MNETAFNELARWVTEAGLIGRSETELMAGFAGEWQKPAFRWHAP